MKKYSTFLHHRTTFSGLIISDNHVGNDFEVNVTHVFFLDFCQEKVFFSFSTKPFSRPQAQMHLWGILGGGWGGLLLLKTASEMCVRNGVVQVDLYLPQSAAKNKDKNVSWAVGGCLQETLLQANIVCCNCIENGVYYKCILAFCVYLFIFIWDSCWRGGRFLWGKKLSFTLQWAGYLSVIHNRLQIEIKVTPLAQH